MRRRGASRLSRLTALAGIVAVASACTTLGPSGRGQIETRDEHGFTISERARVGGSARSDFADAVQLLEEENYDAAIALLEGVTAAVPDVVAPHIDLGIAYNRADDLESAEASMKRALAINPRHPVAHNELGIVYRRMGRFADARSSYEKALDAYPEFHFARRNLAVLCDLYLSDLDCAIEQYELYTREVPDESVAIWIADLRNRAGR